MSTDSSPLHNSPDILVNAMQNVALSPSAVTDTTSSDKPLSPIRPFISYTQAQILFLYKSPLVLPPQGMPLFKDWFGDWNEQNTAKKDSETSAASSGARDKRFRRDQDDAADLPPRATFRSTLSQPSQMGNFKHQSIRTSEREKDKDADRERERDLRDKEGQERLRSLSDKYDRDRLSSPAGPTSLRNRERDSAPHSAGSTGRLPSQGNLGAGATRRSDGRDSSRRKAGESSEDWRRGREERSDGLRREREDRERPRSRVRDSSRQRRDASPSRRDRELDRDRDEHRKRDDRRDDHIRRDRDVERDNSDDPRRWRDDGRRDERMAARRELRDKEYRDRERGSRVNERDSNWDSDRPRDRDRDRWVPDERDSRSKRSNGRDKGGHSRDEDRDGKDRDDRKDSRVRVEEKEPAWMDAYIPSESGAGILGGKAENGEMDGIQAWKLGMKEKERKERESEALRSSGDPERTEGARAAEPQATPPTEPPLDEIQLFKLMIKREEEKNKTASLKGPANDPVIAYLGPGKDSVSSSQKISTSTSDGQPISGFAQSPSTEGLAPSTAPSTKPSTPSMESPRPPGSRFFPNPSASETSVVQVQQDRQSTSIQSPIPSQFNPPSGSRLLAFGSRTPSATTATTLSSDQQSAFPMSASTLDTPPPSQSLVNGPHRGLDMDVSNADNTGCNAIVMGIPPGFSNSINLPQSVFPSDNSAHVQSEILRRQSLVSFGDRMAYGPSSDLAAYSEIGPTNPLGPLSNIPSPSFDPGSRERGHGGSPFPQQKGSRFAKFFDGKSREQPATPSAEDLGSLTHPVAPYQRQQNVSGGESYTHNLENRTMEDIFAMLQNSTQGQRLTQASVHTQPSGYGQNPLIQQHANLSSTRQPQPVPIARNHDILYDNRVDDRNFVPDGMVPGLRSTFPPRRESGIFQDPLDDLNAFNVQQRIPTQRPVDQMYSAPLHSIYHNQTSVPRNPGLPMQQPFRNGNSPNPTNLHASTQRLPPGLANLGGRPPHDPSQFLGSIMSAPSPHLQGNGSSQPAYNFSNGGVAYPTGPQIRGPPGVSPNIQNTIDPGHVGSLLHANKLDLRTPAQPQLVGLNNGIGATGLRAPSGGFPQQNALPMHVPHAAMRQQPHIHQQAHPQAISHLLPQHIQASGGGSSQPAQDLIALLMHGVPRD